MSIEQNFLNCYRAMTLAEDPRFKAIWYRHMCYWWAKC